MNKPSGQINPTPYQEAQIEQSWKALGRRMSEAANPPERIMEALSKYARGEARPIDIHRIARKEGWVVNLRTKNGVEMADPSGKVHWIPNGNF